MQLKSMKISESAEFKIDLKTVISIIVITSMFVGMYYSLQAGDILVLLIFFLAIVYNFLPFLSTLTSLTIIVCLGF